MPKAGVITIDVQAGTSQFVADLDKASGKLKEFGSHGVSNVQATSAALRVLEGNMQNNLRAAERFLANTLNLGPVLKAAFPVVGAIAFAGVIGELIGKVAEFYKSVKEAPEKLTGSFRELNNSIRLSNDELRVANDRLANNIAKLEGRRENNLKLALDEARLAADKLAEALNRDLQALYKVLDEQGKASFKNFARDVVTGQAGTDDIAKELGGETGFGGFTARVAGAQGNTAALKKLYEEEIGKLSRWLTNAQALQNRKDHPQFADDLAVETQTRRIEVLNEALANLRAQQSHVGLSETSTNLQQAEKVAQVAHSLQEFSDRMTAKNETSPLAREFLEISRGVKENPGLKGAAIGTQALQDAVRRYQKQWAAEYLKTLSEDEQNKQKLWHEGLMQQIRDDEATVRSGKMLHELDMKEDEANIAAGRNSAQHQIRLASIGADDPAALAAQVRDIKLQQVEAERKIIEAHREDYDMRVENARLDEQTLAAQQEYDESIAKAQDAALKSGGAPQARLAQIQAQLSLLNSIKVTSENIRDIELARKALHDQMLRTMADELLTTNRALNGVRAFFLEMQEQAKTTAQIVYDSLNSALDRISGNLARMGTGQKTSWGKDFQQIGQSIMQDQIKSQLQHTLALFGVHGGIPTGKAGDPKHVVVDNLAGATSGASLPGAVAGAASKIPALGSIFRPQGGGNSPLSGDYGVPQAIGGFLGGLLNFGGFRAAGGDVDPGSAFLVGENGPELFRPPGRGTIVPNHQLGGSVYYSIDARGADLGASNRVARAIDMAHTSAVVTSVHANAERMKRTPQRSSSRNAHV